MDFLWFALFVIDAANIWYVVILNLISISYWYNAINALLCEDNCKSEFSVESVKVEKNLLWITHKVVGKSGK